VVCFRYTIVNAVHTGDNRDNNDVTLIVTVIVTSSDLITFLGMYFLRNHQSD